MFIILISQSFSTNCNSGVRQWQNRTSANFLKRTASYYHVKQLSISFKSGLESWVFDLVNFFSPFCCFIFVRGMRLLLSPRNFILRWINCATGVFRKNYYCWYSGTKNFLDNFIPLGPDFMLLLLDPEEQEALLLSFLHCSWIL